MENGNQNHRELEIIKNIESLDGRFDTSSNLPLEDQLLICESVAESTPIPPDYFQQKETTNENGSVNGNGSDNGICKRGAIFEFSEDQLRAISRLKTLNYKSSQIDVDEQLKILFGVNPSYPDHWLYIAQHRTPRQINWSINYMLKLNKFGRIRKNPAACFTNDIKNREQKKDNRYQKKKKD